MLIVGAGRETERNYFRGLSLKPSVKDRFVVNAVRGPGQSARDIIEWAAKAREHAEQRMQEYTEVWCILDVEGPGHRKALEEALAAAKQSKIRVCLSNPCFEVWLLAHFEQTHRAFGAFKGILPALNKHWRSHFGKYYEKNDREIYCKLSSLVNEAVCNAEIVREKRHGLSKKVQDCDSSTDVYLLVKRLMSS